LPQAPPITSFVWSPFIATSPAHYVFRMITRMLFVRRHKSWSTSLCNPFLSSVKHYLLSPNIFLGTLYLNILYIYTNKYMRYMLCDILYSYLCVNNITTKKEQQRSILFIYRCDLLHIHTHKHTRRINVTL
jgi:hypothetical protein